MIVDNIKSTTIVSHLALYCISNSDIMIYLTQLSRNINIDNGINGNIRDLVIFISNTNITLQRFITKALLPAYGYC